MRIEKMDIRNAEIFQVLLDNFPDMIHSVDDDGNIVYTNKTAEKLLGYTREALLSMNIKQLYADEILESVERGFADLKKQGDYSIESLMKAKDGTPIPVEIRSFSIYDDKGEFVRTFSIVRDIRQVKELQQSLVHAGRLAAIGELASGVAHDINNPLTVVMLSNDMIMKAVGKAEIAPDAPLGRLESWAKDILRAARSIRKLCDHLRNFSRGMAEKREIIDLYDSVGDALFIANNRIVSAHVEVDSKLEKGSCFIYACPNHVEQVFVNLITNACDAMLDRPTRKLTISVEECEMDEADSWKCDVADTGGGIPEDIINDIFSSFFTTKEKGKGTGLGLSICRGIVSEHNGSIEAKSKVGKGTVFSVIFPKSEPPEGGEQGS